MIRACAGRWPGSLGKHKLRNLRACRRCYSLGNDTELETVLPKDWHYAKPFEAIPGPTPLPVFGNAWRFLVGMDFLKILVQMNKRYGDIVKMRKLLAIGDIIILYNVKDIEWMFRNEGAWPVRDGLISSYTYRHVLRKDIFGDTLGLVNGQKKEWGAFRTIVNPIMMQPRTTHHYIPQINDIADELIELVRKLKLRDPKSEMPENFLNVLNKWAFESITAIALDTRLGVLSENPSERAETAMHYILEVVDLMLHLDVLPTGQLHMKFNTPVWKKFVKNQDFFTDMCLELIEEAQHKINNNPNYNKKSQHEKSIFEKLVEKDKKVAMVMILDMMGAGVDTTAKTVGATLYFLSKSIKSQEMLRAELKRLLPNKNSPITKTVLDDAKYLRAVIKESLRIAPIAGNNIRKTTKPLVFGGYQVPDGSVILIPNLFLSALTDKYYTNPKEYIPERWLREVRTDTVNPFVTLPFGFGPRSCIGKRMANMEVEVIIAKMVRNFFFEWHYKDMTFKQAFLYEVADPLKIRVTDVPT